MFVLSLMQIKTGAQRYIGRTNNMQFFFNCTTVDEVKQLYKQLAKQHHPDLGGDTATMQQINTEYAYAIAKLLKGENLSAEEINEKITLSEKYREAVEKIMNIPGIIVELVGNWIWVTGATYPARAELKAAGFHFASKKCAWYFRAEEFKMLTRGKQFSLEEIKAKYGSEAVYAKAKNNLLK